MTHPKMHPVIEDIFAPTQIQIIVYAFAKGEIMGVSEVFQKYRSSFPTRASAATTISKLVGANILIWKEPHKLQLNSEYLRK